MKNKKLLLGTICGLLIASISASIVAHHFINDACTFISVAASLTGAIANLLLAGIAVCAYKKHFLDPHLAGKNVEAVVNLLSKFQCLNFSVKGSRFVLFIRTNNTNFAQCFTSHRDDEIVFTERAFAALGDFVSAVRHPFLPQSISKSLNALTPSVGVVTSNKTKYAVVDALTACEKTGESNVMLFNERRLTIGEFLSMLNDVRVAVREWLEKNAEDVDADF